ncbi:CHAP domain-containing protein [Salinibacterium sp. M195]|uniref:CHAP domain-containing protein n=1 Tax=Salinibacterium sp. M195 TaxID=2583374 RepID=UPI002105644C|nr:CHAP domain-containing protein [Salinibacterium sp. M195]QYH35554.1 CHAP domain-containing protein [Salinibacterium sp. M195]
MPSDSTAAFGVPASESHGDEPVFLSRREARAAREAAEASSLAVAGADVVPEIPVASAATSAPSAYIARSVALPASAATAAPRALVLPKRVRRHPLRAVGSMLVIGGLFAVAGLPAYGQSTLVSDQVSTVAAAESSIAAAVSAQSLTVSDDLALPELERDQFAATSPQDLELIRQQAAVASANALYAASGARDLGDDYPWPTAGNTLSPLNYYFRQCTDFVAWRLNRDVGSYSAPFRWAWADLTPNGGDAAQWKSAWESNGWTVSATPVVGSVAWFGWNNHVAYVKQVNEDGTVLLEEYNYIALSYGQRTLAPSEVEAFLYPPGQ